MIMFAPGCGYPPALYCKSVPPETQFMLPNPVNTFFAVVEEYQFILLHCDTVVLMRCLY